MAVLVPFTLLGFWIFVYVASSTFLQTTTEDLLIVHLAVWRVRGRGVGHLYGALYPEMDDRIIDWQEHRRVFSHARSINTALGETIVAQLFTPSGFLEDNGIDDNDAESNVDKELWLSHDNIYHDRSLPCNDIKLHEYGTGARTNLRAHASIINIPASSSTSTSIVQVLVWLTFLLLHIRLSISAYPDYCIPSFLNAFSLDLSILSSSSCWYQGIVVIPPHLKASGKDKACERAQWSYRATRRGVRS